MCGERPIIHAGPISEFWELLTKEQNMKIAVMKMDQKIQWLEAKINNIQKMIELKKNIISDILKVHEMMK